MNPEKTAEATQDANNSAGSLARLGPWLLLLLLGVAVYSQVWQFDPVRYDDPTNVFENPHVMGGVTGESIRWAFDLEASPVTGIWHPVTWISFMIDAQMFGAWPGGYHLTNVLLHIACAMVLFGWLASVTGARWRSLLVAAIFVVHPVHVESVAWISERKNLLSTLFGLLALWAYCRFVRSGVGKGRGWYGIALAAFALSLLAKPMLVTLPFLLILLDLSPLERGGGGTDSARGAPWSTWLLEKVPFFLLSGASSLVAVLGQRIAGSVSALEAVDLPARLFNAVAVYGLYLYKTILPWRLAVFYPHPKGDLSFALVLGSAMVVALVTGFALMRRREQPALLVGWLWYLGTLVPVLGVLQVGSQQMADRYLYVPQIGLLIAGVWILPHRVLGLRGFVVASGVVVAALAMTARAQVEHWRDSETLFEHAVAVTRDNHVAHQNLGVLQLAGGDEEGGLRHLREAARIKPRFLSAHLALAHALLGTGQIQQAYAHMERAVEINPGSEWMHDPEGHVLTQEGTKAARASSEAWSHLAELRSRRGDVQGVATSLLWAERADPSRVVAQHQLATFLVGQGHADRAEVHLRKALELDADDRFAHNRLGVLLQREGRLDEAVFHFEEAVRLEPSSANARFNLGVTLLALGRRDEGIRNLEESLRLDPDLTDARLQLDAARSQDGGP